MEKIQARMAQEVSKIEERKGNIEDELKEVKVGCQVDLSRATLHHIAWAHSHTFTFFFFS